MIYNILYSQLLHTSHAHITHARTHMCIKHNKVRCFAYEKQIFRLKSAKMRRDRWVGSMGSMGNVGSVGSTGSIGSIGSVGNLPSLPMALT